MKHIFQKVVFALTVSLFCVFSLSAQINVTGTVNDDTGGSLPGVNVIVKGTATGVVTDANGRYNISAPNEEAVLVFSFLGYGTQEVTVGNRILVNVTLSEGTEELDEIVVIGYGTVRKKDLTGSITQIRSENILKSNQPTLNSALQGIIPAEVGSSWKPGTAPTIEIRGISSITGSNDPLWVVDGIPMQSTSVNLNPNDIQSVDILKDASAAAIYGARGSNGVIIVTTKHAAAGESGINISYSGWVGLDKVFRQPALMQADEYANYKRAAYKNAGDDYSDAAIFDYVELASIASGSSTDWFDLVWGKTAIATNHNLTINASGKRMGSMLSLGYLDQGSLIETAGFKRYNVNFNNTFNLSERVKLTTAILGTYSKREDYHEHIYHMYYLNPLGQPYDENGQPTLYPTPTVQLDTNPLQEIANNRNTTYQYALIGSAGLEWNIWDELRYKFSAGMDLSSANNGRYSGSRTRNRIEAGGAAAASYENTTVMANVVDNILSYNKAINENHRLDVMAAFNMETYRSTAAYLQGTDMYYDGLYYNMESAATVLSKYTRLTEWGIMSLMGRLNYSLYDRYLLTFTYRYDGSSRLADKNKWAGFPSMSVAWRLSEESFLGAAKEKFLDNLKLRLSWGNTGNTNVDPYKTLGLLAKTFYTWDESPAIGTIPSGIPNPDLKWERLEEYNFGIDFGLFKSRVTGSIDLYNRTTKDLIMSRNLPVTSGYTTISQNIGSTRNRGIELILNGDAIRTKDFTWNIGITFSRNRNEILDLYGDKKDDVGSTWFIGHPIRSHYLLDFIGVWQEHETAEAALYGAKPGYPKYRDVEGTAQGINLADDRVIMDREPNWIGGLNTTLSYKGFDLYMQLYTRQGVRTQSPMHASLSFYNPRYNCFNEVYWMPENRSNTAPAPSLPNVYTDLGNSDYYVKDMSFVRLSNISLGYTLPQNFVNSLRIEQAKVYINISNPYVWTSYTGQDPQSNTVSSHPAVTSFQLGLNLNF